MLARIHDEMMQSISHLDDNTKGKVLLAYINYQLYGEEPSKDDILVYSIFKAKQFDLDCIKEDIEASIENGKKGGAPRGNQNARKNWEIDIKQPKTTQNNLKQPEQEREQEQEKEQEKEKRKNVTKKEKSFFENNDLNDTFVSFIEMRKQLRKPMTNKAIELAIIKLEKMYPGDVEMQKLSINQSIENSRQGLFEVKPEYLKLYGPPGSTKKKAVIVDPNKVLSLNEL